MSSIQTGASNEAGAAAQAGGSSGAASAARARRAAPPAMRITEAAAARVKQLMAQKQDDPDRPVIGLRISVGKRGCSGMSYEMEYATERNPLDEVVEDKGVTLLIDAKAQMYLFGTEIDYVEDRFQAGFVFRNPNEKGRCGCGESFHV